MGSTTRLFARDLCPLSGTSQLPPWAPPFLIMTCKSARRFGFDGAIRAGIGGRSGPREIRPCGLIDSAPLNVSEADAAATGLTGAGLNGAGLGNVILTALLSWITGRLRTLRFSPQGSAQHEDQGPCNYVTNR